MQKNTNKIKKSGTNFDLTADSLIENIKLFQTCLKLYCSRSCQY